MYKTVVRPAMLFRLKTLPLTERLEAAVEVEESEMLRFLVGDTGMDRIRNECIRRTVDIGRKKDKLEEARLVGLKRFGERKQIRWDDSDENKLIK